MEILYNSKYLSCITDGRSGAFRITPYTKFFTVILYVTSQNEAQDEIYHLQLNGSRNVLNAQMRTNRFSQINF